MGFSGKYATDDSKLVLNVTGTDDGALAGDFNYNGKRYPIVAGSWHVGNTPSATYCLEALHDPPGQIRLGAAGIIKDVKNGSPSQITISGAAAVILGEDPNSGNAVESFSGLLNLQGSGGNGPDPSRPTGEQTTKLSQDIAALANQLGGQPNLTIDNVRGQIQPLLDQARGWYLVSNDTYNCIMSNPSVSGAISDFGALANNW